MWKKDSLDNANNPCMHRKVHQLCVREYMEKNLVKKRDVSASL